MAWGFEYAEVISESEDDHDEVCVGRQRRGEVRIAGKDLSAMCDARRGDAKCGNNTVIPSFYPSLNRATRTKRRNRMNFKSVTGRRKSVLSCHVMSYRPPAMMVARR